MCHNDRILLCQQMVLYNPSKFFGRYAHNLLEMRHLNSSLKIAMIYFRIS